MELELSKDIDLNSLDKDQLIALVQVRGQAMQFYHAADDRLLEKIQSGDIGAADIENYLVSKVNVLAGLTTAEEKIIAGVKSSRAN